MSKYTHPTVAEALTASRLNRRQLIVRGGGAFAATAFGGSVLAACGDDKAATSGGGAAAAEKSQKLVLSIRDLTQENSRLIQSGAKQFAGSIGQELQTIVYNNDSNLELSSVKSAAAKTVLLNSWPNTAESTPQLLNAIKASNGYLVTHWNKPDDLHPWDVGDNYVAHVAFDAHQAALTLCDAMFKAMNGEGGICAIQGLLDATNAQQGFKGVEEAVKANSGIKLLDQQAGDWDRTKALNATQTWINRFGDDLKGIWAANDDMALGAVEALRSAGMAGKVFVVGSDGVPDAVQAVKKGDMLASILFDSYWQGGIGLALAHAAATGKLKPSEEPKEHREFYGPQTLITKDNADKYIGERDPADYDFSNLFGDVAGQIRYA
jgi:ribose transport system substrate-binding protein